MQNVEIYTDGACIGNPGPGGWAAILISGEHKKEISGGHTHTTNNEMELMAIIEALEALKYAENPALALIYTDSTFAINAVTGKFKLKKPQIIDLVNYINETAKTKNYNLKFRHVKGHNGDPLNERADKLASQAAERSK
mgnify:CR=1 FL=1